MNDRSSDTKNEATGALHSLERWKTVQVDRAQAAHVERQRVVNTRSDEVARVQRSVEDSQTLAREYLSDDTRILNADALLRMQHYSTVQTEELKEASALLRESQNAEAKARGELQRKFEERSAVERLRERRSNEAAREAARREQKRLDDQALLKSAANMAAEVRDVRRTNANKK